jgi:hypothetical protein
VTAAYARVFGNDNNEIHACRECTSQRALANGAALRADRDGTLLVHRPDAPTPVPTATDDHERADEPDRPLLSNRQSSPERAPAATRDHADDRFEQLVAE